MQDFQNVILNRFHNLQNVCVLKVSQAQVVSSLVPTLTAYSCLRMCNTETQFYTTHASALSWESHIGVLGMSTTTRYDML